MRHSHVLAGVVVLLAESLVGVVLVVDVLHRPGQEDWRVVVLPL